MDYKRLGRNVFRTSKDKFTLSTVVFKLCSNRVGMKRFTEIVNLQWSRKILLVSVCLFFLDPFTYDLSLSALSHQSDGYYNV